MLLQSQDRKGRQVAGPTQDHQRTIILSSLCNIPFRYLAFVLLFCLHHIESPLFKMKWQQLQLFRKDTRPILAYILQVYILITNLSTCCSLLLCEGEAKFHYLFSPLIVLFVYTKIFILFFRNRFVYCMHIILRPLATSNGDVNKMKMKPGCLFFWNILLLL